MTKKMLILMALLLLVLPLSLEADAWKNTIKGKVELEMTDTDTLDTGDQSSVDSLAHKAARITLLTTNQYGSNAASFTRKNWGALHIYDGPSGTDRACGQSIRMLGDSTFAIHIISAGDHSSGIKLFMDGTSYTNQRGLNVFMPANGDDATQTGILVRDLGSIGTGVAVTKYVAGAGMEITAIDTDSTTNAATVPLQIYNYNAGDGIDIYMKETDGTVAAKSAIDITIDTLTVDGNVRGIQIGGNDFNTTADLFIKMLTADGESWGFGIDPTSHALGLSSSEDTPGYKAWIDTLGVFIGGGATLTGTLEQAVGSNIASAATITLGEGNSFIVTGTADIDSIDTDSPQANGTVVYLLFSNSAASNGVVDGKNLGLAGNFAYAGATADGDILALIRINNVFYEISRSAN